MGRKKIYTDEELKERTKQRMKEYNAKPEVKQCKKEYAAKPERKQYMKEYAAKPEIKQYKKGYAAKPEVKQRDSQRMLVRRSKGGYVSNIERQLIYERDAYKCAYAGCNKIVIVGAPNSNPLQATIDHIIPISKGGLSIYSNMITMCRGCNCNTKRSTRLSDETRLLELAHARNIEFGLVDSKTKWEKGQQDDRVAGMGGG
jgi:5-methylcytosine-specific restriction endonuclease McrA